MQQYTKDAIRLRMFEYGMTWPQNHLVGIRSLADEPDKFDDHFYWFEDGALFNVYEGTTNPGSYYLQNFINKLAGGTAVMASNQQMIDGFVKGEHHGNDCWRQYKPMKVFRDSNKDLKSDETGIPFIGMYGIHLHSMNRGVKSTRIFNWSAACQGMNVPDQWNEFISRSYEKCDKFLTYTLLREFQLNEQIV
jgi:hypothetical protein